ncbi:MAG: TRAP transporter small permease [Sphingobacteriales bacterium]|jgi:TRAP-type C4-dicarboxylate transport system permease small subunit
MSGGEQQSKSKQVEEFIFIRVPHVLVGALFLIAAAINIVNVIARYIFSDPIFWAEEVQIFIVIWTVFLVAGSITYRGAHLNMDLIYSGMSAFWKRVINLAIALTLIACTVFTAMQSWKVLVLHYHNHSVTAGTDIPLVIPHAAVLFGFSFMALAAVVRIRSYISGKFE